MRISGAKLIILSSRNSGLFGQDPESARISQCMDDESSQFELSEQDSLALLIKHEPAFRAYARSIVPDWDLVDEALQEATVTMWQKRGQLESTDGFLPWARVILRFKCLRQVEKLRSQAPKGTA